MKASAWAPIAAAAGFAAVLVNGMPRILAGVGWNSDVVTPMVLAEELPAAPAHPTVYMGNSAPYTTLWIDQLTLHLPAHRALWMLWPYAIAICGLLLLAWTSARCAGRWAGLLTLCLGLATGPSLLFPLVSQGVHGLSDVNVILLVWLLVVASDWMAEGRRRRVAAVAVAVALVTGANLASDPLLLVAGIGPFAAAPALMWVVRRDRRWAALTALSLATTLVTLGFSRLVGAVAHVRGLHRSLVAPHLATPAQAGANLHLLWLIVQGMGNGQVIGGGFDPGDLARALSALLVAGGFVITALVLLRALGGATGGPSPPLRLYLACWTLVELAVAAAFVLSDVPVDRGAVRYLVPAFYATAAAVPAWAARSRVRRIAAGVAAAVYVAVAATALEDGVAHDAFTLPPGHTLPAVLAVLRAHHLDHGYAGYWQANALTWQSHGAVRPRAVNEGANCDSQDSGELCPYRYNVLSSWFRPRPGPSFLLVGDPGFVDAPPSARLGPPSAILRAGAVSVYVYPYDLAQRLTH